MPPEAVAVHFTVSPTAAVVLLAVTALMVSAPPPAETVTLPPVLLALVPVASVTAASAVYSPAPLGAQPMVLAEP